MSWLQRHWFKLFIYLSLIFLVLVLVDADYLITPKVYSPGKLSLSLILLSVGFLFNAVAWKQILAICNLPIDMRDGIVSTGLAVFGKYIPGKLWALIGQGGYVAKKYGYSNRGVLGVIINAQLISIWVGLILSAFALLTVGGLDSTTNTVVLAILVLLSLLLLCNLQGKILVALAKWFKSEPFDTMKLSLAGTLLVAITYLINWCLWSLGFYFLAMSLMPTAEISLAMGLAYALALTLGFLAVIVPGGIGVREGILVVVLSYTGMDAQMAITISAASRLWFMCGEFFIFILALLLNRPKL